MRKGDFKFVLHGERLNGRFVLVRMKPRPKEHAESWLLIKERDGLEREGVGAGEMEAEQPAPRGPETKPRRSRSPPPSGARSAPASPSPIRLTHEDRELWPGITKRDLADLLGRRSPSTPCPASRIARSRWCAARKGSAASISSRSTAASGMPAAIREGHADQAYVAIDDLDGLIACVQFSTIELHTWGCTEDDPHHADRLVFDLDPGEGVAMEEIVRAAREVRDRLGRLGLESFCRTSGGKGLHVVAPALAAPVLGRAAPLVPRIRAPDGGGRARPLRLHRAQGPPPRAHPGRLAAQRARLDGRRLLRAARPARTRRSRRRSPGAR